MMPAKREEEHLNRTLGLDEVKRLVATSKKDVTTESIRAAKAWPGNYNIRLLAEACDDRRQFVTFDNNRRFRIRYDSVRNVVFIKPADGGFVPCGYFSFKQLKEALDDSDE